VFCTCGENEVKTSICCKQQQQQRRRPVMGQQLEMEKSHILWNLNLGYLRKVPIYDTF